MVLSRSDLPMRLTMSATKEPERERERERSGVGSEDGTVREAVQESVCGGGRRRRRRRREEGWTAKEREGDRGLVREPIAGAFRQVT
jgi:hypothetical protein